MDYSSYRNDWKNNFAIAKPKLKLNRAKEMYNKKLLSREDFTSIALFLTAEQIENQISRRLSSGFRHIFNRS